MRVFAALSATAILSALTVSGASASILSPAVTGGPNAPAVGSNCLFSTAGTPCYLRNRDGFYTAGDTHGDTVNTDSANGSRYIYQPYLTDDGYTYGSISTTNGALCWNFITSLDNVYLDSCQTGDANELFAMVPCPDGSWCISNFDWGPGYRLYGAADDTPISFVSYKASAPEEWDALSST